MNTKKQLYRDPSQAKIAGVCAGVADYFGIESWLVRILFVSAFFLLAGPFMFLGYIAAWFILEKKPIGHVNQSVDVQSDRYTQKKRGKGWHNPVDEEAEKIVVKSKVWQAGEPAKQAFLDISQQFKKNEIRLRNVEKYVTSKEFQLNREISRL